MENKDDDDDDDNKISNFGFPVRQLKMPRITEVGFQLLRISLVIVINMKYMV